mgnify:CR=1 FL=1
MFERKKSAGKIYALPIESIQPSPFQARTNFNEQELAGLAASIRENGLLQPIAVRKKEDGYELVAGERRLRACKMAKMQTIPAILCDYADDKTAAMGLLENLQRENLNPFEQAQGLRDVMVLCPGLLQRLYDLGYESKRRSFTPLEVRVIVDALGEP